MKKKIVAMVATVCLMFTLFVGCGSGDPKNNGVGVNGKDGPMTPYADTLNVSMLYETNAGLEYPEGETIEDNIITRFLKEKLNMTFDLSWQVDAGNYATQLDLAIAGNTGLPDMFIVNKSQMYTLASGGQITNMNPYYEKYASKNLKKVMGFNENEGLESVTLLDGMYALPLPNDVGDGASLTFIRKDWLDKLNLEAPKTLDGLVEVARAFVKNDMSGRGNTIGIGLAQDMGFTFDVFCNACGGYPDIWREGKDGKLEYGSIQPGVRKGLEKLQQLYKEGLIHKEFAAQDNTRLAQYVAQGRLGIFIGPFWYNNNYIISNLNADPEAEWIAVGGLPLKEGDKVTPRVWNTTYRWLAVNSNCANPEAAVKLLNMWYEIWQGEYSDWFWDNQMSEKYYKIDLKEYSPVFFDPPLKNIELGRKIRKAYDKKDPSKLNAEGRYAYSQLTEDLGSAVNRSAMLAWFGSFKTLNDTYESFIYDEFRGPEDVVFSAMMKTLDEMKIKTFVDIVMGADISEFDKFIDDWYKNGGQTVTDQVNAWAASK